MKERKIERKKKIEKTNNKNSKEMEFREEKKELLIHNTFCQNLFYILNMVFYLLFNLNKLQ